MIWGIIMMQEENTAEPDKTQEPPVKRTSETKRGRPKLKEQLEQASKDLEEQKTRNQELARELEDQKAGNQELSGELEKQKVRNRELSDELDSLNLKVDALQKAKRKLSIRTVILKILDAAQKGIGSLAEKIRSKPDESQKKKREKEKTAEDGEDDKPRNEFKAFFQECIKAPWKDE